MVEELYETTKDGAVVLHVHVQPGAGRSAVTGRHGNALKVRVAAPPQGGRANTACAELLAATFGLKPAQVTLAAGDASRTKRFRLEGLDLEELPRLLTRLVEDGNAGAGPGVRGGRAGRPAR